MSAKAYLRMPLPAASADARPAAAPDGSRIERIADDGFAELADLMVDGYRGTIDFEGETPEDALEELRDAAAGSHGPALRDAWLVRRDADGRAVSAIVCARWRPVPLILYVFTAADATRRGHAGALIRAAAAALAGAGETELALFVTIGNPARSLYEALGFVEAAEPAEPTSGGAPAAV